MSQIVIDDTYLSNMKVISNVGFIFKLIHMDCDNESILLPCIMETIIDFLVFRISINYPFNIKSVEEYFDSWLNGLACNLSWETF